MNMVSAGSSTATNETVPVNNIDPFALFEALTGRKINRGAMSVADDYVDIRDDDDDDHRNRPGRPGRPGQPGNPDEPDQPGQPGQPGNPDQPDEPDRGNQGGREPRPDKGPNEDECNVGAINPFALVECLVGRRLDHRSMSSTRIIADVLQTDYDELFDMKHDSVLYAGLRLNNQDRNAQRLNEGDIKILNERDLVTPDLSRVERLEDLEKIGLKNMNQARVKFARMENGKLRLIIDAPRNLARTVNNREVTNSLNRLALPFRKRDDEGDRNRTLRFHERDDNDNDDEERFHPPNSSWRDMFEVYQQNNYQRTIERFNHFELGRDGACSNGNINRFDDPRQGACGNSHFVAALFSVYWANPGAINRATRASRNEAGGNRDQRRRMLSVRLHDKGGSRNNNKTAVVDVNYEILVNNSSNDPLYCRSGDNAEIWPALYEKAYAKWITGGREEHPDITQTANGGDPIKTMAQINGREPQYWQCEKHDPMDLISVVRNNCVNHRTINPMAAWTHATARNNTFRGANLVANHAYSVLGWAGNRGDRQYVVLRNPWGVTEPSGLNSYPGLIDRVEPELWHPACMLDRQGVIAMEANAFRECFAYIGVAR